MATSQRPPPSRGGNMHMSRDALNRYLGRLAQHVDQCTFVEGINPGGKAIRVFHATFVSGTSGNTETVQLGVTTSVSGRSYHAHATLEWPNQTYRGSVVLVDADISERDVSPPEPGTALMPEVAASLAFRLTVKAVLNRRRRHSPTTAGGVD